MHRKWKNKGHEYDEIWAKVKKGKAKLAILVIGEKKYLQDLFTIIDQIKPQFNRIIRYFEPYAFETEQSMECDTDEKLYTVYQLKVQSTR